ncbi:Uncharacterised protein [Nocardia africana]|uniref:Uncharacterized protein n=1 Tax=Nocardia africana TaxID=134964 RepID=A0A378WJC1_9NOCA|nr:Uncharacterised protein [Nocardia africana]
MDYIFTAALDGPHAAPAAVGIGVRRKDRI